ncbi:Ribonuclease P protein component 4 [uncultured archaeon]|nr:Ribonuclease P protein component 4 [uncultured archaeon]
MNKNGLSQIGTERIYRLFELAEQELEKHPERSVRYVQLSREISKKTRARFPDELKLKFCKKCNAFIKDGYNGAITESGGIANVKCLGCGFERKTGRKSRA